MALEIERMLVLSTEHVSQKTAKLMSDDTLGSAIYPKGDYGWWVYVWDDEPDPCPDDLKQCVAFARKQGCQWVMFDRDGPSIDQLPTYDW